MMAAGRGQNTAPSQPSPASGRHERGNDMGRMKEEEALYADLSKLLPRHSKRYSRLITALIRACYEDAAKLCIDKTDAEAIRRRK